MRQGSTPTRTRSRAAAVGARKLLLHETKAMAKPKITMEYAPWIEDPDPPERRTNEQLDELAKRLAKYAREHMNINTPLQKDQK
jgi:hypothetical protein